MNYSKIIGLLTVLLTYGCNKDGEIQKFIRKYPESKEFVNFLYDYKHRLTEKENSGLKFKWTLRVYCDDRKNEGGFNAIGYICKDNFRFDARFTDGKQLTRIFHGRQLFEYVNQERSTEFIDRWNGEKADSPAAYPILGEIKKLHSFRIDSIENKALLRVNPTENLITIVFPLNEPEKFSILYHDKDYETIVKKTYGLEYKNINGFILPVNSISEIPNSNYCNRSTRYVEINVISVDFNWTSDDSVFEIMDKLDFYENME